jgi:CheY-like chemotaxis protein
MASAKGNIESLQQLIESEFLDETRDVVSALDVLLGNMRSNSVPLDEALGEMQRDVINLESRASSVNQPLVAIVVHRMGEYLVDLKEVTSNQIEDLQTFVDRLRGILDGDVRDAESAGVQLVRALPVAKSFDLSEVKITNVEGLLVIPDKAMQRIIARELAACGYRVSNARTPFQAIELAVRTKPDFIIAAAVMDGLSGIELACALSAMPSTAGIPFALLTSFGYGHASLAGLPPRAAIIRKGAYFGEDFAEALSRFNIT